MLSMLIAWFGSCGEQLKPSLMPLIEQLGSYSISGTRMQSLSCKWQTKCSGACMLFIHATAGMKHMTNSDMVSRRETSIPE